MSVDAKKNSSVFLSRSRLRKLPNFDNVVVETENAVIENTDEADSHVSSSSS